VKRGPWQVLIALDQLANAVLGGSADETISSRAWKAKLRGKVWGAIAAHVIDALFYPIEGPGHCERAAEWDEH